MKRILALFCAALLACLCCACGEKTPEPGDEPAALLTLYADKQPLRIITQEEGVSVTLQLLEHEPTVGFLRPIADEWQETLEPGKEYEIDKELADGMPAYRLFVRQGESIAIHNLTSMGFEGKEVFTLEGKPWAPAPVHEGSPMINLCRAAAVSSKEEALYDYWYVIANAISTQRGVYNEWPPDEADTGEYRVPEWLFEAYAAALFPGKDIPVLKEGESGWVSYHPETHERYWVGPAWSTWIWADYKSAKRNSDGTWDVVVTIGAEGSEATADEVIKLAPNETYNPDSPFEYHIIGLESSDNNYDPPEPAPPPPEILVGTWRAPVKEGHVAWLEIYEDGMAGLYLGDDESDQLYEIYKGTVCQTDDTDTQGSGVDYVVDMEFTLDWYIYESDGGAPVTGVPDTIQGLYILRQEWEGGQQALYVTAGLDADDWFGKADLKMLWVPKTLGGGSMMDIESVG